MKDPFLAVSNALERSRRRGLQAAAKKLRVYDDERLDLTDAANVPPWDKSVRDGDRCLLKSLLRWMSLFF
jgi:hypothetical protein